MQRLRVSVRLKALAARQVAVTKRDKVAPECVHTAGVRCSVDVASDLWSWSAACGEDIDCGHQYTANTRPARRRVNPECSKACGLQPSPVLRALQAHPHMRPSVP